MTAKPLPVALLVLTLAPTLLWAAPEPKGLGDPGPLKSIQIETGRSKDGSFALIGVDASQQLLVTGQHASGQVRDLTPKVSYTTNPAGIVAIAASGLVTPLKEGQATITVKGPHGLTASVPVTVRGLVQDTRVSFNNQIVPIFTKAGCNTGACHGKASGQNGFKLSLFGFEPGEDHETLVGEARGRRLFFAAPAQSLLLLKATATAAHGGGKRLEIDSPHYVTLRRWIEQGAPASRGADPVVQKIEVLPRERLLDRESAQQLTVIAHLSDGSTMDITRLAQFESGSTEMAKVSEAGLVTTQKLPGSVAIMARYQAHVDVFRAIVPLGAPVANLPAAKNFVDELVFKQLQRLGLPPSAPCDDGTFIRRVTIDIAGRLPTREETEQFVADKDAQKHEKLVDRLLASPDYAYYFAAKWSAVLRNRRRAANDDTKPTAAFHEWIRTSLHENKPFDKFVREVLTARGPEIEAPPVVWYRELKEADAQMEDVSQLFLGQRISCAKCHHHPFEKWSQQDYWGMVAFFSRVEVKDPPPPKGKPKKGQPAPKKEPASVAHKPGVAQAVNPKTNLPVKPAGLGGNTIDIAASDDPREKLVDWMTATDNPFFARVLVNRYWKHFLGVGLVDPEDDLRSTNPASNPELLEALARHFVDNKYDLKKLIRTICTSQVYRLSAVPNEYNAEDRQNFSRFLPKRLNAEVLLDAIDDVTQSKTTFKGMPAGTRAVQLPDSQFESYFLSVFGRPDAASACECERKAESSLPQALHLFNSAEIQAKVAGPRCKQLASDKRPPEERLREVYLIALSREPSKLELTALLGYLEKKKASGQAAYEDILWAVLNTKEFLFNH
ncbi:MAG: DUF1549 domain-containing protein [Gemmataceae bacterium]